MNIFGSMTVRCLLVAMGVASCALPAHAGTDAMPCSTDESIAATDMATTGRSLQRIRLEYKRYGQCDQNAVAEKFAGAISLLLSDHWGEVRKHEGLLVRDAAFREFLVRHVGHGMPADRLTRIARNANERCPDRLKGFCRDIAAASN